MPIDPQRSLFEINRSAERGDYSYQELQDYCDEMNECLFSVRYSVVTRASGYLQVESTGIDSSM